MKTNPQRITGNWTSGWTLDLHTVSSVYQADGTFDTTRTELGEHLYQVKYQHDKTKIRPIADTVAQFIQDRFKVMQENTTYFSAIIPIPPSRTDRPFQPVLAIATEVGKILNIPVPLDYLTKIKHTPPLKDIEGLESRKKQLEGAFTIRDDRFAGKHILLFDDLYRSGETLTAATKVLKNEGKISKVFVMVRLM
jgi:predicted amidophosphoribosyltransferase